MSSDTVIKVESLSKCYHIYNAPHERLKQFVLPRFRGAFGLPAKSYFREFWAVRDVSFEVRRGETVGILGFNGAGKSTLLQLICGTMTPTQGKVQVNAKIAALLELGAGFNPEFTGRENVFMNCSIQGMSRAEIEGRFEEIASFAGIGDFMDQPVKNYSSGMFARLAFSAAVHVDPGVLIVDEALSVGDMAFQERSFTKMKELRSAGTSILFVSHSTSAVRNFCDRAIWLERGQIKAIGDRLQICDAYEKEVQRTIRNEGSAVVMAVDRQKQDRSIEDRSVSIVSATTDKVLYSMGDDIRVDIRLHFQCDEISYGVGLIIYDSKGNIVSILNTLRDEMVISEKKEVWSLLIRDHHFAPGEYTVTVSIPDEKAMFSFDRWEHCMRFAVEMQRTKEGLACVEGIVRCEHEWQ